MGHDDEPLDVSEFEGGALGVSWTFEERNGFVLVDNDEAPGTIPEARPGKLPSVRKEHTDQLFDGLKLFFSFSDPVVYRIGGAE